MDEIEITDEELKLIVFNIQTALCKDTLSEEMVDVLLAIYDLKRDDI